MPPYFSDVKRWFGGERRDGSYRYRARKPLEPLWKSDGYQREKRPYIGQPEKERKSANLPEKAATDLPSDIMLRFKAKAQKVRETVRERAKETAYKCMRQLRN